MGSASSGWGVLLCRRPRKCLKVHTWAQETTAGGRGWQSPGQERCPGQASGVPPDREQVLLAGHVPCPGSQRHPVCLPRRVLLGERPARPWKVTLAVSTPGLLPWRPRFLGESLFFKEEDGLKPSIPERLLASRYLPGPGHPSCNSLPRLRAKQIKSGIILIERINTWG